MRKLCLFALPFCAGTLAACLGLPLPFFIGIAAGAAGILLGCLKKLRVCLICLGLACGLLWFQGYSMLFRLPAQQLDGQSVSFTAAVTDWPEETSTGSLYVAARLYLEDAPDPKILLYIPCCELAPAPGDTLSGQAKFTLMDTASTTVSSYYEARGIFLRANTKGEYTLSRPDFPPVSVWPAHIAQVMKTSIARIFPEDVSGFMTALLTGDKDGLSDGLYSSLQRSGAAHVVAVSGLHISFFVSLLALFFPRRSKVGIVLTLALVFLFAAVAGFSPSVMRAAFMVAFARLASMSAREEDKATTLSAILMILLLFNPYSILSVSLQLSFASVAGIYSISSPLYRAMTRSMKEGGSFLRRTGRRLLRALAANLSVTLGALLLTTPLCAWYFGTVSIISPLTNLLILWAVSLVFSAGLILTLLGLLFPAGAAFLSLPVTLLARGILAATGSLGRLAFSSLSMDNFYAAAWLVLVYLLIILVVLFRCRRPVLPVCVGAITLCITLLFSRLSLFSVPFSATVLDVGQGQCILLRCTRYTALVDCGGTGDNAGDVAADYLQSMGISHLDLLVLTHCHDDHVNGVPELFARLDVSALILPRSLSDQSLWRQEILSAAREEGAEITELSQNQTLPLGDGTLTLYPSLTGGSVNEDGLFLLATYGKFDLLVTGDADSFSEWALLKRYDLPDVEVLVAGHHGAKTSTCEGLLDTLTPETCLISSGPNSYGHPAPETLSRLAARNISVYRTDLSGHLTVRVSSAKETDHAP